MIEIVWAVALALYAVLLWVGVEAVKSLHKAAGYISFSAAAVILSGADIMWIATTEQPLGARLFISAIIGVMALVALSEGTRYVYRSGGEGATSTKPHAGGREVGKNSPNIISGGNISIGHIGDVINPIPALPQIDLTKNEGILIPANLPAPSLPRGCVKPSGALAVFLGATNVTWATQFPHVALYMANDDLLVIDREKSSETLTVKALRVFGRENRVIASIHDGEFWVSANVRKKRPDQSTLIVYDEYDTELLRLKLLNPTALMITGVFRHPKISPITYTVTETDAVQMPNNGHFSGNCLGNGGFNFDVGIGIGVRRSPTR